MLNEKPFPEPYSDQEETEKTWTECIERFRLYMWPVFERQGFTFSEAFLVFRINGLQNTILESFEDTSIDDDEEPWKK